MGEILFLQGRGINSRHIEKAKSVLESGDFVVIPTETGYCYAGLAHHKRTHQNLLALRLAHPQNKPFSLLCKDAKQISEIAEVSTASFRMINKVLPGPFTLVLPSLKKTPAASLGAFRGTVGVRMTSHPLTRALLESVDSPLMVTSVTDAEELEQESYSETESDETPDRWWTTAEGILSHSNNKVPLLLSGEEPLVMRFSTVIDLSRENEIHILRDGGWPLESQFVRQE
ncbi:MAG: hypothetical protein RIR26_1336 [Pseudomonadota bacterium]|jgi:tRNA threonylcarbamoyl adenosine modification protein (Sua5/YciO/YrdC/YwlC family)